MRAKPGARINQVKALHRQGYRNSDIGAQLGIVPSEVTRLLGELGLEANDANFIWGSRRLADFKVMAKSGASISVLARNFGCTKATIRCAAAQHDLNVVEPAREFTPEDDLVIRDWQATEQTLETLARILGRSACSVSARVKLLNDIDRGVVPADQLNSEATEQALPENPNSEFSYWAERHGPDLVQAISAVGQGSGSGRELAGIAIQSGKRLRLIHQIWHAVRS